MSETISIVLIDDNRLLREGIAALIREEPNFHVLVASADIDEALSKVREYRPHVVLLDLGLQKHDSLRLTATVHAEVPEARVIVMGLLAAREDVGDFIKSGASGFIMKEASLETFLETIRQVAAGQEVLPAELTGSLFDQIARNTMRNGGASRLKASVRLTARERQVIDLIGVGLSNKEIASRLHIAIHTVKSHVHNVLEKLALHTRLEVAAFTRSDGSSWDIPS